MSARTHRLKSSGSEPATGEPWVLSSRRSQAPSLVDRASGPFCQSYGTSSDPATASWPSAGTTLGDFVSVYADPSALQEAIRQKHGGDRNPLNRRPAPVWEFVCTT